MTENNATKFAEHYEAATILMLDAMGEGRSSSLPKRVVTENLGETFSYAHAEATRAHEQAHRPMEAELARQLASNIAKVALEHGIRLRAGK